MNGLGCCMRRLIACLWYLPLLLLFAVGAQAEQPASLKVCADPHMLPFSNIGKQGYENKIAELFGQELGMEVQYSFFPQRMGFIRNTLRAQLEEGTGYKCDLVITVPDGFELASTTIPYYASTWVLVYARGRGYDELKDAEQLSELVSRKQLAPRIGATDRGPGQLWVFYQDMMGFVVPYQGHTGDVKKSPAYVMLKDIMDGKLDMAVVWGPFAGYYAQQYRDQQELVILPLEDDVKTNRQMIFSYNLSMAVRHGEEQWKQVINELIEKNRDKIHKILAQYNIPMVPLRKTIRQDDDD